MTAINTAGQAGIEQAAAYRKTIQANESKKNFLVEDTREVKDETAQEVTNRAKEARASNEATQASEAQNRIEEQAEKIQESRDQGEEKENIRQRLEAAADERNASRGSRLDVVI